MTVLGRIGSVGPRVLASAVVALGIAIVVRTVAAGGGPFSVGVVIGVAFAAAGAGRLYLAMRAS